MAQLVEMVERADFGGDGDRSPPPARAPRSRVLVATAVHEAEVDRSAGEGVQIENLLLDVVIADPHRDAQTPHALARP